MTKKDYSEVKNMKKSKPMNWTKRQIQYYGAFLALLGLLAGIFVTVLFYLIFC